MRSYLELTEQIQTHDVFSTTLPPPSSRNPRQPRDGCVEYGREIEEQPLSLPVLRNESDALTNCRHRAVDANFHISDPHAPSRDRISAEYRPGDFSPPATNYAGKPENLAASNRQRDIRHILCCVYMPNLQGCLLAYVRLFLVELRNGTANHRLSNRTHRWPLIVIKLFDHFPIAQDCYLIRGVLKFLEAMGDIQDGPVGRPKPFQQPVQPLYFRARECRRRLVQYQQ